MDLNKSIIQDDPEQNIWGRLLSIRKVLLKKP